VESVLQAIFLNAHPGAKRNIGISGKIKTTSFHKLFETLSGEEKMKDIFSKEHGFLSLGSFRC